jgi:hypothetical protein
MAPLKLTTFTHQVQTSWRLFAARWRTAVKLALLPLVPLLFGVPFLLERSALLGSGGFGPADVRASPLTTTVALLAVAAYAVVSLALKAGLFIALEAPTDIGARRALQRGFRRFFPFLWTELLTALLVAIAVLPTLLLHTWYTTVFRPEVTGLVVRAVTDALAVVGILALFFPALALAVSLAFGSLATAIGEAGAGVVALQWSARVVRGQFAGVWKRLVGWSVLTLVLAAAVSPLPIARWLVPFLLTILSFTFLVTVYKDLRRGE